MTARCSIATVMFRALIAAVVLSLYSPSDEAFAAEKIIRWGFSDPLSAEKGQLAQIFKKIIEERTNGSIEVQLFPSNQLGREIEQIEGVKQGTQEIASASTAWFSGFFKPVSVFDLPFIITNFDEVEKAARSQAMAKIISDAEEQVGLRFVGVFPSGFRNVYTADRPVSSMEDLQGLKIRLQNSDVHIRTFQALGASPVSLPAADVYQALQTGLIDAAETPPTVFLAQKFSEVAPYYIKTQHVFSMHLIAVNPEFYDGLSEIEKDAFDAAMQAATTAGMVFARNSELSAYSVLTDTAQVIDPSPEFEQEMKKAMAPVYERFGAELDPYFSELLNELAD